MCVSAFLCLNLQVLLTKFWNDDFVLYFVYLVKITVQFPGWGGYFFVVLLPLKPIAYPRPNKVKHSLSTAIKVSTVSISEVLLPSDFSNESISM